MRGGCSSTYSPRSSSFLFKHFRNTSARPEIGSALAKARPAWRCGDRPTHCACVPIAVAHPHPGVPVGGARQAGTQSSHPHNRAIRLRGAAMRPSKITGLPARPLLRSFHFQTLCTAAGPREPADLDRSDVTATRCILDKLTLEPNRGKEATVLIPVCEIGLSVAVWHLALSERFQTFGLRRDRRHK